MSKNDNDNDDANNYLYSAHKPKRRKRIWGERSRDQSRCVLKITSFKQWRIKGGHCAMAPFGRKIAFLT